MLQVSPKVMCMLKDIKMHFIKLNALIPFPLTLVCEQINTWYIQFMRFKKYGKAATYSDKDILISECT
jgi:hypothetical protein